MQLYVGHAGLAGVGERSLGLEMQGISGAFEGQCFWPGREHPCPAQGWRALAYLPEGNLGNIWSITEHRQVSWCLASPWPSLQEGPGGSADTGHDHHSFLPSQYFSAWSMTAAPQSASWQRTQPLPSESPGKHPRQASPSEPCSLACGEPGSGGTKAEEPVWDKLPIIQHPRVAGLPPVQSTFSKAGSSRPRLIGLAQA